MASMNVPKLTYSVPEVCEALQISRTTLWKLVRSRRLKPVRIGRRVLFSMKSLEDLLKMISLRNGKIAERRALIALPLLSSAVDEWSAVECAGIIDRTRLAGESVEDPWLDFPPPARRRVSSESFFGRSKTKSANY